MTLSEIADAISRRLCSIFLIDANGRRPVYGGSEVFQKDPYWRDLILFYEYFHGDDGAGLGASHQTGWTGQRNRVRKAEHLSPMLIKKYRPAVSCPSVVTHVSNTSVTPY
jgi:hypothetical protein